MADVGRKRFGKMSEDRSWMIFHVLLKSLDFILQVIGESLKCWKQESDKIYFTVVSPEDRFEKIRQRQEDIEDHCSGLETERREMTKAEQWDGKRMGLIYFQEVKFIYKLDSKKKEELRGSLKRLLIWAAQPMGRKWFAGKEMREHYQGLPWKAEREEACEQKPRKHQDSSIRKREGKKEGRKKKERCHRPRERRVSRMRTAPILPHE